MPDPWVLVFPGQGAQAVGMGRDIAEALPEARAMFNRADEVLGVGLSKIMFEGPDTAGLRISDLTIVDGGKTKLTGKDLAAELARLILMFNDLARRVYDLFGRLQALPQFVPSHDTRPPQ